MIYILITQSIMIAIYRLEGEILQYDPSTVEESQENAHHSLVE